MLDWHIDEEGAITNMDGIDSPTFTVSPALLGDGFIAVERFPSGLSVSNFAETLQEGIAWCEEAAQHSVQQTDVCRCVNPDPYDR